jgi:hypothetical protein
MWPNETKPDFPKGEVAVKETVISKVCDYCCKASEIEMNIVSDGSHSSTLRVCAECKKHLIENGWSVGGVE